MKTIRPNKYYYYNQFIVDQIGTSNENRNFIYTSRDKSVIVLVFTRI